MILISHDVKEEKYVIYLKKKKNIVVTRLSMFQINFSLKYYLKKNIYKNEIKVE